MHEEMILPEGFEEGTGLFDKLEAVPVEEHDEPAGAQQKENEILRQNAAAAAKAPVRGVTGGGSTGGRSPQSLFEQGFDAANKW